MAMVLNPQLQQLHNLYQQAQDFAQHPPDNDQPLVQLNLQLANAAWDFPEEIEEINNAIANLQEAFGRIGGAHAADAEAQHAAPPDDAGGELQQPYEDVLIPPEAGDVEQVFQNFMQLANAHFAQQRAPQPALSTQSVPLRGILTGVITGVQAPPAGPVSNRTAVQASPRVPVAPITNASATPSQQPVALEPSLLDKILKVFQSAIETLCLWFANFIAYCSSYCPGSSEQQSMQTVTAPSQLQTPPQSPTLAQSQEQAAPMPAQPAVAEPPAPAVVQPQAPAQNQAEPVPVPVQPAVVEPPVNLVPGRFRGLGHLGREVGLARGHECVNAMAAELWEHLEQNNDDENQFYLEIGRALNILLPQADQNNIEDWNFPRYEVAPTQNYRNEIGLINVNAVQARQIKAAKIIKGNEVHLVMIDARDRNQLRYYYFNPYMEGGAYLQMFNRFIDLTDHLAEAVPIDAGTPFALTGLRRLQN